MDLEPVLLEAPLRTIRDRLPLALWAGVERHKLLIELPAVSSHVVSTAVKVSVALVLALQNLFERTHLVLALADVDNLIVWCGRYLAIR
jgi:hypothetical protein